MKTIKSLLGITMLGIFVLAVQSCQKDPCEKPPCNAPCSMVGVVSPFPWGCIPPPDVEIGIMGNDGIFYSIKKDQTGQFQNFPPGTPVKFGLCEVSQGEVVHTGFVSVTVKEAILGCIEIGNTTTKPGNCDNIAEVVGVAYQMNALPEHGRYLKINGQLYAVSEGADEISQYPLGTTLKVGYVIEQDCYLPAVITYPSIAGCVSLHCIEGEAVGKTY